MKVDIIKVGYLDTNCYLLIKDNNALLIDPGDDFYKIQKKLENLNLKGVILTHNHFDHVGALKDVLDNYCVKLYDFNNLDEGNYEIDDFKFKIIYTPGHTSDSITIYFEDEKIMFTGDFIFKGSIGRTDLGGNDIDMKESIKKILKYSNVKIFPGHGDSTTLEEEKNNNLFLKNL